MKKGDHNINTVSQGFRIMGVLAMTPIHKEVFQP